MTRSGPETGAPTGIRAFRRRCPLPSGAGSGLSDPSPRGLLT